MYLSAYDFTLREPNEGVTLSLAPAAWTVYFAQALNLTNPLADGNGFDVRDISNDAKPHVRIIPAATRPVNEAMLKR
jgi:hypothetical protein